MSLGPELFVNGNFGTGDFTGWLRDPAFGWTIDTNRATNNGAGEFLDQAIVLELGKRYLFSFTYQADAGSVTYGFKYGIGLSVSANQEEVSGTDTVLHSVSHVFTVASDDFDGPTVTCGLDMQDPSQVYFDNFSLREFNDPNLYLQTVQMVGADIGDVQTLNVGKDDDGTPIYYELETQGLEFGNVFHRKQISDKIVVFTKDGIDSTLQGKADDNNYTDIEIDLSNRVNIGQNIDMEGNTMQFKWFGEASEATPILEGFYVEKVTDLGITHG